MNKNKPKLLIDYCSYQAAKFACENWHYSKSIPASKIVKFGVWENDQFIGCILFSRGATPELLKPYGLKMTEGCELTRIALKEHQTEVSKIIAITLKKLKKFCPGLKLIVSFADTNEDHHGGIYQASNWIYTGKTQETTFFRDKEGRTRHPRSVGLDDNPNKHVKISDCTKIIKEGKHRYLMPLNDEIREKIIKLKKPYPKRTKQR